MAKPANNSFLNSSFATQPSEASLFLDISHLSQNSSFSAAIAGITDFSVSQTPPEFTPKYEHRNIYKVSKLLRI